MLLPRDGREYVYLELEAAPAADVPVAASFDGSTWTPMERTGPGTYRVLVAGPDATSNPVGTVVLAEGAHTWRWRQTTTPEVVVRAPGQVKVRQVVEASGTAFRSGVGGPGVAAVAGKTGDVTLTTADIGGLAEAIPPIASTAETLAGVRDDAAVSPATLVARTVTFVGSGGTVDDRPALQALVDANPGACVTVRGDVRLGSHLVLSGGHTLRGQNATMRLLDGATAMAVIASKAAVATGTGTILDGPIVIDGTAGLVIDGNWNNVTGMVHGILLASGGDYEASARRTKVINVAVRNCRGDGIRLTDKNASGNTVVIGDGGWLGLEPRITGNNIAQVFGRAINVNSAANLFTDGYCTKNLIGFVGLDGIRIKNPAGWYIDDNHAFAMGGCGILISGGFATRIDGNYVEGIGLWDTVDHFARNPVFRAAPNYAAGTTFGVNQVCMDAGQLFVSLQDNNTGHTPASSPTWWEFYDTQAAVANVMCLAGGAGRGVFLAHNSLHLGHPSWAFDSRLYYRGVQVEGYAAAGSVHILNIHDNQVGTEDRTAPSTAYAYRYLGKTGGLQVYTGRNVALGTWTAKAAKDATVTIVTTDDGFI